MSESGRGSSFGGVIGAAVTPQDQQERSSSVDSRDPSFGDGALPRPFGRQGYTKVNDPGQLHAAIRGEPSAQAATQDGFRGGHSSHFSFGSGGRHGGLLDAQLTQGYNPLSGSGGSPTVPAVVQSTETPIAHQKFWYSLFILAALMGGSLYFLASNASRDVYLDHYDFSGMKWVYDAWLPNIGGGVTNGWFNLESYLTLLYFYHKTSRSTRTWSDRGEDVAAGLFALGTILPIIWTAWLKGDTANNTLDLLGAAATVPVFFDGSKKLLKWVWSFRLHQKAYHGLGMKLPGSIYQGGNNHARLAMLNARDMYARHIRGQATTFIRIAEGKPVPIWLSDEDKQAVFGEDIPEVMTDQQARTLRNKIVDGSIELGVENTSFCLDQFGNFKSSVANEHKVVLLAFAFLIIVGMYQNLGFTWSSMDAGKEVAKSIDDNKEFIQFLKYFAGFCNLVPSLGFTIQGLTEDGLLEVVTGKSTTFLSRKYYKTYCGLATFAVVMSGLSGFTGDYVNSLMAKEWLGAGIPMQVASGVAGNVGIAFVFNLVQLLCSVNRMLMLLGKKYGGEHTTKAHIAYFESLNDTADYVHGLSAAEFEAYVKDNGLTDDLLALQTPRLAAEDQEPVRRQFASHSTHRKSLDPEAGEASFFGNGFNLMSRTRTGGGGSQVSPAQVANEI